jgi:predicted metal-binding transcription factor (methanogenesis marker protein 9)
MQLLEEEKLRDLPGWGNAPVPICMGGDYRALTFCCKPGYSLSFEDKCKRDEKLKELGISAEQFIKIKEDFSKQKEINWDTEIVCFGTLSYCCMRRHGCSNRDFALMVKYPDKSKEEVMKLYFEKKKELAKVILKSVNTPEGKKKVKPYLNLF